MDMVVRSRHILASIINSKTSEKYDIIRKEYEDNKISKEAFCVLNEGLRNQLRQPEEIDKDTVGEEIDDIDRWNMENVLEDQHRKEVELKNARNEITRLEEELAATRETQKRIEKENTIDRENAAKEKENLQRENRRVIRELKDEMEKGNRMEENVEKIKAELDAIKKHDEQKQEKKEKRKRAILWVLFVSFMIVAISVFVVGTVNDTAWARAIGAVLGVVDIFAIVIEKIKRAINNFFSKTRSKEKTEIVNE